jgi:predicted amidohydrolase
MIQVAAVQFDIEFARVERNVGRMLDALSSTSAQLCVFPECAVTGYCFESRDQVLTVAEPVPGPSTERLARACRELGKTTIVGLIERAGNDLFNAAAVIGPRGVVGCYRKMHLPFLGLDRFATPGDLGFPVFDLGFGKVGVLICYDLSFPEAARVEKLHGADLICVPTNWPQSGAEVSCEHSPFVRAQENHVHVITANRIGTEAGFTFLGHSRIIDCTGRELACARREQTTITATLDLAASRQNRVVNIPGRYELDRMTDRRPAFYRHITGEGIVAP